MLGKMLGWVFGDGFRVFDRAMNVTQWFFLAYLGLLGFIAYGLFFPHACAANNHRSMCVPSALQPNEPFDVWVYASPSRSFERIAPSVMTPPAENATIEGDGASPSGDAPRVASLMHAAFGLTLGDAHEANVTVPCAEFGTRALGARGELHAHLVLVRSTPKSRKLGVAAGAPAGAPLVVASAAITKLLAHRANNYTMLLGDWSGGGGAGSLADERRNDALEREAAPERPLLLGGEAYETIRAGEDARSSGSCAAEGAGGDASEGEGDVCERESDDRSDRSDRSGRPDGSDGSERSDHPDHSDPPDDSDGSDDRSGSPVPSPAISLAARLADGALAPHVRPRLGFYHVANPPTFHRNKMPGEMRLEIIRAPPHMERGGYRAAYKPLVAADDVSATRREYLLLDDDSERPDPVIALTFKPLHVGLYRLMTQMTQSLDMMRDQFGMTESDLDDLKEVFTGTNWRWMAATFAVSLAHSWFAFLAFKNDVGFWKKRSNLEGLSVRSQWSSFVCQLIVFANLVDTGQASTIILCEMGVGVAIEAWKVSKFLQRDGVFRRWFGVGGEAREKTQAQKDTDAYDKRAMRVLGFCLYPIVAAYGAYSLVKHPQRSWRSWTLRTLANGVYMFGFIAMCPQLYINYKLKSVAHLPWKAFMYKAFNTFIDDVFAFAVTMPTIHRLACLRDDLVFFVYLYQRWIYPIDKKRVNEFGRAYEEDEVEPAAGEDGDEDEKGDEKEDETKEGAGDAETESDAAERDGGGSRGESESAEPKKER